MAHLRHAAPVAMLLGILVGLAHFRPGAALTQEPTGTDSDWTVLAGNISLATDPRLQRVAATFAKLIQHREWDAAAHAAHMLMTARPEIVLPHGKQEAGKPPRLWTNARVLGRRLFDGSPAEVKRSYDRFYDPISPKLVKAGEKGPKGQAEVAPASDWPLFRGNSARSGVALGALPLLDQAKWRRPTIMDTSEDTGDTDRGKEAQRWLDNALQQASTAKRPVLTGSFPIAAADRFIYRTYVGVTAVWLRDQKDAQGQVIAKAGTIDWKSTDLDGSLGVIMYDDRLRPGMEKLLSEYNARPGLIHLLYESSAVGAVAADQRLVYTVDNLAIPAPANYLKTMVDNRQLASADRFEPLFQQNVLYAFEIEGGKLKWRLPSWGDFSPGTKELESKYANTYFLGTPLAIGDNLHVLNETQNGELRLLCIDPMKYADPNVKMEPAVLSVQGLGTVNTPHRIAHDMLRRTHTISLAYAAGPEGKLLLVPTNAGALMAMDLETESVRWVYAYDEGKAAPPPQADKRALDMRPPEWFASGPVIHGERVIFTGPDEPSVHCLRLADGIPLWQTRRSDDDLYVAGVFKDKVLLVGRQACRALDLASGKELWHLETGVPSGMGAGEGRRYYLPLRTAAVSKLPGVCAIDVYEGRLVGSVSSRKGEIPGNLVFQAGQVLSQTPTSITAYPVDGAPRK